MAYRTAAADAISHSDIEERQVEEIVNYSFTYPMMNDVMRLVKELPVRILHQSFDNTCEITLAIRKSQGELLRKRLEQLTFK